MEGLLILGAVVIGIMWLSGAFKDKKSSSSSSSYSNYSSSSNSFDEWDYSYGCHHDWSYSHKGIDKHWYTCKKCGRRGAEDNHGPRRVL